MNFSAPRVEAISSLDSSQEQYAGHPEHVTNKRLARGFHRSIIAGCTIPPLVFLVSLSPLHLEGTVIVTTWVALMLVYIFTAMANMRDDLRTGERKWNELRDNALTLETAYERLGNKYNVLYAELLLERGVVSLVAKRSGKDAAAGLRGVESAAVVPFTKTDGAGA
jgi:hypothetical protein